MNRKNFLAAIAAMALLAPVAASADVLDKITQSGVVRIGIMTDYPPFGTIDANFKPQGYDIDMSALLAKAWGVKVEFVTVTAPNRAPMVQTGKVDIMFNIGRSEERAKVVDFSQPYAPYYIGIYGSPGSAPIPSIKEFNGRSIAVTRGAIEDRLLTEAGVPNLKRFEDNNNTISAFMTNQADTMAIGNIVALSLQGKPGTKAFEEKLIVMNSPVHAAVGKGEARLLDKLNGFFTTIKKDGSLDAISRKWLKQPLAANLL